MNEDFIYILFWAFMIQFSIVYSFCDWIAKKNTRKFLKQVFGEQGKCRDCGEEHFCVKIL